MFVGAESTRWILLRTAPKKKPPRWQSTGPGCDMRQRSVRTGWKPGPALACADRPEWNVWRKGTGVPTHVGKRPEL